MLAIKLLPLFFLFVNSEDMESYIYLGTEANIEDYPSQIGLLIEEQFCGGNLISANYILTAAHCVNKVSANDIRVLMGFTNIDKAKAKKILSVTVHSGYVPKTLENDIAVIEIDPVTFSDTMQPIDLPNEEDLENSFQNEDAIIVGWGQKDTGGALTAVLLAAEQKVMKQHLCANLYMPGIVKETNICSIGEDGSALCHGDSGGPLILKSNGMLIGISSFGPLNKCRGASGFTRVTKYREWIREQTGV